MGEGRWGSRGSSRPNPASQLSRPGAPLPAHPKEVNPKGQRLSGEGRLVEIHVELASPLARPTDVRFGARLGFAPGCGRAAL